jgi:ribosomal protein L34E
VRHPSHSSLDCCARGTAAAAPAARPLLHPHCRAAALPHSYRTPPGRLPCLPGNGRRPSPPPTTDPWFPLVSRSKKTPGGKNAVHYQSKTRSAPKCGDCKKALIGLPRLAPLKFMSISKRQKTVRAPCPTLLRPPGSLDPARGPLEPPSRDPSGREQPRSHPSGREQPRSGADAAAAAAR